MDEDDMDFTPSPNTSSNLASLFGFTKKPLQGNSSLTYTAPKPPKGDSNVAKKPVDEKTKNKIIFSKAVHAYKLEKGAYNSQGLIGIAISGNYYSRIYEIILYKRNKEHLSRIRISSDFLVTVSSNNYVFFYDNNKQNWSLMFQSTEDMEQFCQKISICKFYSHSQPPQEPIVQDLVPSSKQSKANFESTVQVSYSSYALIPEEISKLSDEIKTEKIVLSKYNFVQLSRSLVGCEEHCKRLIIIPHSLSGPWLNDLNPDKDLLLEVKVEKIITEEESSPADSKVSKDGIESPIDSSAEELNVKAKGASLKEALSSTKSQKANLISRMARMGQATLPVKAGLSAEQSDSEEESVLTTSLKPRLPRSRVPAPNMPVNTSFSQTPQPASVSQQVSVYQNDLQHQSQFLKQGVMYQQLIPVSASPVSSPTTDPNLSVFVSESRIQAAELRMGMSKISEKLDQIWNKMQNSNASTTDSKIHQMALMDSVGILGSIQNLISENESLKGKVEEQKQKIEQQNERIYQLLELNHKYLEQNSTSHEKLSANESKLKAEMESLQKKEIELETSNRKTQDKVRSLTETLTKSEEVNTELRQRLQQLNGEMETLRKNVEGTHEEKIELENLKVKLTKAEETINQTRERLKEVVLENDYLKPLIKDQKEEIERGNEKIKTFEDKNKELEIFVGRLKKQILDEEKKTESKIESSLKVVAKLENENKILLEKIQKQDNANDVKATFSQILPLLKNRFPDSKEYSSSYILTSFEEIFKQAIDGNIVKNENVETPEVVSGKHFPGVVPAPRKSLQTLDVSGKEKEAKETEETNEAKKPKEEVKAIESEKRETEAIEGEKEAEAIKTKETIEPIATGEAIGAIKTGKEEETTEVKEKQLSMETEKKEEEKKETEEQKKREEIQSRYKSYDQGWRTTKPPPPPLLDDDEDLDDWLI